MADLSIRKDFVDGVYDIFTTLFNSGVDDGLKLYLLSDETQPNVYGESKYKMYKQPIMLTTQARLTPTQGEQDVEGIKDNAEFVVPLKALQDNNLGVTNADLDIMRKGVIEFHGVFYEIDNIAPKAYIEDVFLMYTFYCSEDKHTTSVLVESPKDEETDEDSGETDESLPNEDGGDTIE